jgi:hypothetical protein
MNDVLYTHRIFGTSNWAALRFTGNTATAAVPTMARADRTATDLRRSVRIDLSPVTAPGLLCWASDTGSLVGCVSPVKIRVALGLPGGRAGPVGEGTYARAV